MGATEAMCPGSGLAGGQQGGMSGDLQGHEHSEQAALGTGPKSM